MVSDTDEFIEAIATEKLAALRPECYFRDRAGRVNPVGFPAILEKAGRDITIKWGELRLGAA